MALSSVRLEEGNVGHLRNSPCSSSEETQVAQVQVISIQYYYVCAGIWHCLAVVHPDEGQNVFL